MSALASSSITNATLNVARINFSDGSTFASANPTVDGLAVLNPTTTQVWGDLTVGNIVNQFTDTVTFDASVNLNGTTNFATAGTANLNGNTNFAGGKTATFNGTTNLNGNTNFAVATTSTFNGNANFATGKTATFNGTLTANGTSNFDGITNINGNANFANPINMTNAVIANPLTFPDTSVQNTAFKNVIQANTTINVTNSTPIPIVLSALATENAQTIVLNTSTSIGVVTLPSTSVVSDFTKITIYNVGSGPCTINRNGSDTLYLNGANNLTPQTSISIVNASGNTSVSGSIVYTFFNAGGGAWIVY